MADATLTFPRDFLWGTATAAHQVEGGNDHNQWHAWEQGGGGRVFEDQVSGAACDWWAGQAEKDIRRMKELHTNAHRLSVEWSRVEPEPGRWDNEAIDRYRAILEAMRKAGVQPMVTLHHFTNPLWFEERGSWLSDESVTAFERFVKKIVGEMSDLCTTWCTINEPSVYAAQGYFDGSMPPGKKDDLKSYFTVLYNLLNAHAAAYHAIHDIQPTAGVGLAHHMIAWHPRHRRSPLDRAATGLLDQFFNSLVVETIRTGVWKPLFSRAVEASRLKGTLDWFGLNYYDRYDVLFSLPAWKSMFLSYGARPGEPQGPKSWGEFYPEGLFTLIMRLHKLLRLPIAITENGVPDEDDSVRPGFILEHLAQVWRAINFNVPVTGYYFWSLVDNFEWAEGYDPRFRFGLYQVDFKSQKRTIKPSGELYKEICAAGAISSDMARRYAPDVAGRLFPGEVPQEVEIG